MYVNPYQAGTVEYDAWDTGYKSLITGDELAGGQPQNIQDAWDAGVATATADVGRLFDYVSAHASQDDEFVTECWFQALELVVQFVGSATPPDTLKDRAMLDCGSRLFYMREAKNGILSSNADGTPVYVGRDPMNQSYALLRRWVTPF